MGILPNVLDVVKNVSVPSKPKPERPMGYPYGSNSQGRVNRVKFRLTGTKELTK